MLTRSEIIGAFKAILHRAPESDAVVDQHAHFEDVVGLCDWLVRSAEFKTMLSGRFGVLRSLTTSDLQQVARDFVSNNRAPWEGSILDLPRWVDVALDPDGARFRDQTLRFWEEITGRRSYDALVDEDTPEIGEHDAIVRLGFYASGNVRLAGAQMMAMGHIIRRSEIRVGDRVLEYGAGFGQTALALARFGARVDTVDINPAFCRAVQANADLFKVDLTAHVGQFGFNPCGVDGTYDLVFFYESFHHCLDFHTLIPRLRQLLKPNGRVILAGEPIFDGPCSEMPYPWGFRLDWENVAVMRIRGWMELGFQRDYLLGKFREAGFDCAIHKDPNSHWAQVYKFKQR